jgi:chemotaxis protein MotB
MAAKRKKHEEHEEHANHERWLVSYADMMTLLMVLFIVMFAISQVDQRRFEQLKDGMAAGFGQSASPFQGSEGAMQAEGISALTPIRPQDPTGVKPMDTKVTQATSDQAVERAVDRAVQQVAADHAAQDYADAEAEVDHLEQIKRRVLQVLADRGYLQDVRVKIDDRGLAISLVSRHIVFQANRAELSPRGEQVLRVLAPVLAALPNRIEVDGHTNQVKVKPKYYPTDWELSAARAVNVLRYLDERGHVPARRMTAVAYGHERPLRDPSRPGAAALNKRVDLVVVSDASENARGLFTKVMADRISASAPEASKPTGTDG